MRCDPTLCPPDTAFSSPMPIASADHFSFQRAMRDAQRDRMAGRLFRRDGRVASKVGRVLGWGFNVGDPFPALRFLSLDHYRPHVAVPPVTSQEGPDMVSNGAKGSSIGAPGPVNWGNASVLPPK